MKHLTNKQLGYLVLRVTLGLNIMMHGIVRLPHITHFAQGLVEEFSKTFLPAELLLFTGYFIAIAEAIIGFCILIGLFRRYSLLAGAALMMMLMFGMSLLENWSVMGGQMIYTLFYYFLLRHSEDDVLAIDNLGQKK